MKINPEYKLEKIMPKESDHRTVLRTVLIETKGKDSFAITTNGRALAKVPVTMEETDTAGFLTPEALKLMRKARQVVVNGSIQIDDATFKRPTIEEIGKYPDYERVLEEKKEKPLVTFRINAELLKNLADALGSEFVNLTVYSEKDAIKVTTDAENVEGRIMPSQR